MRLAGIRPPPAWPARGGSRVKPTLARAGAVRRGVASIVAYAGEVHTGRLSASRECAYAVRPRVGTQRLGAGSRRRIATTIATATPTPMSTSPTENTLAIGSQAGSA